MNKTVRIIWYVLAILMSSLSIVMVFCKDSTTAYLCLIVALLASIKLDTMK